jgi:hypothetical protein
VNRAELVQTTARGRANLDTGVPTHVVAAEPCGLRLADPPARLPAGVAAVVEAVRAAEAGAQNPPPVISPAGGKKLPGDAPPDGPGGNLGGVRDGVAGGEGDFLCATRLKSTPDSVSYRRVAHRNGVALADVVAAVSAPARSVQRWLVDAVAMGALTREGAGRWTRYRLPRPADLLAGPPPAAPPLAATTGVAPATTVAVPVDAAAPRGDVGGHFVRPVEDDASSTVPPPPSVEIVTPAPHPREPNAPKTATGRRPKRPTTANVEAAGPPARYRLPDNAPRLTGAARDAMLAELRQHLRAASWRAKLDHLEGHDRDDLAVDEVVALFGEPPPAVARGP